MKKQRNQSPRQDQQQYRSKNNYKQKARKDPNLPQSKYYITSKSSVKSSSSPLQNQKVINSLQEFKDFSRNEDETPLQIVSSSTNNFCQKMENLITQRTLDHQRRIKVIMNGSQVNKNSDKLYEIPQNMSSALFTKFNEHQIVNNNKLLQILQIQNHKELNREIVDQISHLLNDMQKIEIFQPPQLEPLGFEKISERLMKIINKQ